MKAICRKRIRNVSKSIQHETCDCTPFCPILNHRSQSQIVTIVPQPLCQRNKTIVTIEVSARKTGGIKLCSFFYFAFALISELDGRWFGYGGSCFIYVLKHYLRNCGWLIEKLNVSAISIKFTLLPFWYNSERYLRSDHSLILSIDTSSSDFLNFSGNLLPARKLSLKTKIKIRSMVCDLLGDFSIKTGFSARLQQ